MKALTTVIREIEETFRFFAERKMHYEVKDQKKEKFTIIIDLPLMNAYKKKLMIADIRDHLKEESFRYQVKKVDDQLIVRLR